MRGPYESYRSEFFPFLWLKCVDHRKNLEQQLTDRAVRLIRCSFSMASGVVSNGWQVAKTFYYQKKIVMLLSDEIEAKRFKVQCSSLKKMFRSSWLLFCPRRVHSFILWHIKPAASIDIDKAEIGWAGKRAVRSCWMCDAGVGPGYKGALILRPAQFKSWSRPFFRFQH